MYKWLNTVLCIFAVTPHAGVRIEIIFADPRYAANKVTPHAGVRIEILPEIVTYMYGSHPPRGGAN